MGPEGRVGGIKLVHEESWEVGKGIMIRVSSIIVTVLYFSMGTGATELLVRAITHRFYDL